MNRLIPSGGTWILSKQTVVELQHPLVTHSKLASIEGCARIWDPTNARFDSCALRYVFTVPAIFSAFVLLALIFKTFTTVSLPLWATNFVKEEPSKLDERDASLPTRRIRFLGFEIILSLFSVLGLLATVCAVVSHTVWILTIPHAFSWGISIIYIAIVRPRTSSGPLCAIHALVLASDLTILLNGDRLSPLSTTAWSISCASAGLALLTSLLMPLRHPSLPSDAISKPFTSPTSGLRSPEDNLTLWQWMSVSWMKPMITEGKSRQLQFEDVWSLGYEFEHARLHEAFRVLEGSVFRRLMKANGVDLIITSSLGIVESLAQFAAPVLLQKLLQAMENPESPRRAPLVFAILALAARLIAAQAGVFKLWFCRRVYERSRGEMITMLYEKTLSRKIIGETVGVGDNKDQNAASTGKVLNIMRGDVYEVAQRFWEWPDIIVKPLGVIISVILVWNLVGWPCLLGLGSFIIFQALMALIMRLLLSYERTRRAATDQKLKITTQFIEAIRHLRYNSWEGKWRDGILAARQKELNIRMKTGFLVVLLVFASSLASGLFPVFAFLAFTLIAGQRLRVDIAFPALQLFDMLEQSLNTLPNLVTVLINSWVAMGRIETFMGEPDRQEAGDDEHLISKAEKISVNGTSFAWPGLESPVLRKVNVEIEPGMTVVHGRVGAGKSALLQALLGELDILEGNYRPPNAMIAYCGQTPWLQNMSIRENILFGYPMDKERYRQVLAVCALTTDLAGFQNGDLSFVGENGIGLSGGQKARVALARAIYSSAPFLFLDDPISALDQQTAEHIMKQCIAGPLCRDRSVVLVTHRLDLVQGLVHQVIEVTDGQVSLKQADLLQLQEDQLNGDATVASGSNGTVADHGATDKVSDDAVKDKFIEEEKRAHGTVKLRVYWQYIKAGRLTFWSILILAMILSRGFSIAESWFLKAWGESYDRVAAAVAGTWPSDPFKRLPSPENDVRPWLVGFALLAVGQSVSQALVRAVMVWVSYYAGKSMFKDAITCVSNAAFRFYDVTPVGRLMNRMTSDFGTVDGTIGMLFYLLGFNLVDWASSIIVIASVTPAFFAFALVVTASFVLIYMQFLPTSQNLRRLEMVSLSPLMANFGTLIEGLVTVRAFRAQRRFQAGVIRVVDTFQKMDHFYWSLQAWLMIRFDSLSAFSTLILTLLAIYTNTSPGLTAFVLTAAASFVSSTHSLCKNYGQLELNFTSVERVVELFHIDQEPAGEKSPPAAWPTSGEIIFDKVDVRYAPHLDLVLQDVNLKIPGGSNVAVVGRTGSGKSTMALALLATVRPVSGKILLDGLDICTLKPSELRRRITFLAQEPTLFVGSMRANLDPLEEFGDEECSGALARLGGERYGWTLETHVEGGGKNLSQGQRQLVQLARAILRRSPLVILDEATASIDLGTSLEVQDILRQEMGRSTVITIAHRVEAVNNADWCIELAHGRVIGQGPPGSVERVETRTPAEDSETS